MLFCKNNSKIGHFHLWLIFNNLVSLVQRAKQKAFVKIFHKLAKGGFRAGCKGKGTCALGKGK